MTSTTPFVVVAMVTAQLRFFVRPEDCAVLVTGASQPWTPARQLTGRPPATSIQHSFATPPPGARGHVVFSLMSTKGDGGGGGAGLDVRLFSSVLPGGYIIYVDTKMKTWTVERDLVTDTRVLGRGQVVSASAVAAAAPAGAGVWESYRVTVGGAEQLELQRLHGNGTSSSLMRLTDPQPLPVDRVSLRSTQRRGWTFWRFDCVAHFHGRDVCHLWPSWDGVVPRTFPLPTVRISPTTSLSVHVQTVGETAAQLLLYENEHRYYVISLTPSALSLTKVNFGLIAEVARSCLTLPAQHGTRFRLLWVSVLAGVVQVGLNEPDAVRRPCPGQPDTATDSQTAGRPDTATDSQTAGRPDTATDNFLALVTWPAAGQEDTTASWEQPLDGLQGALEVSGVRGGPMDRTEVARGVGGAMEDPAGGPVVAEDAPDVPTEEQEGGGALEGRSVVPRTSFLTWHDIQPYYVLSYGFRTQGGYGRWTVDCTPAANSAMDDELLGVRSSLPAGGGTDTVKSSGDTVSDSRPGDRSRKPSKTYMTALTVLSALCALLLVATVVLSADTVSRRCCRRRRAASPELQRRLSLSGEPQLTAAAATNDHRHQYAELRLYDNLRPMSTQPGYSSFKPVRRRESGSPPPLPAALVMRPESPQPPPLPLPLPAAFVMRSESPPLPPLMTLVMRADSPPRLPTPPVFEDELPIGAEYSSVRYGP